MTKVKSYPEQDRLVKLKQEVKRFCQNTTLHGFKFMVLPERTLKERIFWAIICIVSIVTALSLLLSAWFKFRSKPTVIVTDTNHHPIWNYPFPAVTVCNFNKISKRKAFALAKNLTDGKNVTEIALDLRLLFHLIKTTMSANHIERFYRLQDLLDRKGISVDDALEQLAPTCDEMLLRCKWKFDDVRCNSIFEPIKTTVGHCCAFNYFALKNHTFSGIFASRAPKTPRKISACGYETGLEVMLENDLDDYFAPLIPSNGHQVLIHHPYSFPDWNSQTILSESKTLNLIGVSPTISYSTEGVRSLPVDVRDCSLSDGPSYFHQYTFQNCMTECRINLTKELCKCIPFYHIQKGNSKGIKICTLREIPCLEQNRDLILSSVPGFNFASVNYNHLFGTETGACKCLSDCEGVYYLSEASSGTLSTTFSLNQPSFYGGIKLANHSLVRVFFNDIVGIKNRLDLKFNWYTLLAYYGGLLGLFLGFSFVSGIEILNFIVIKLLVSQTIPHTEQSQKSRIKKVQPADFQKINYNVSKMHDKTQPYCYEFVH